MKTSNFKVIQKSGLERVVKNLKRQNKKIVFTNGCFDLLHVGHIQYLEKAKKLGNVLIVGINSDKSVKKLKGTDRPIMSARDRAKIISSLSAVDYTVVFNEETPSEIISQIKPDIHVKGGDYKIKDLPEYQDVLSNGGQVKIIPYFKGKSTTNIINKIQENVKS